MAKNTENKTPYKIKATITLMDGRLYAGEIPICTLTESEAKEAGNSVESLETFVGSRLVEERHDTIWTAFLAARREFRPVIKTGRNSFLKKNGKDYEYATFDDIVRATFPALSEHGLMVVQKTDAERGTVVTSVVQVSTGETISDGGTAICVKNAADPQAFAAGLGWAKRLGLSTILGITSTDDDTTGESALGF